MLSRTLLFSASRQYSALPVTKRLYHATSAHLLKTTFVLPDPSASSDPTARSALQLTKIVATIGPTSEQAGPLQKVVDAGMRVMRLNFSHATTQEVELRCANLAAAQSAHQSTRAILLDTKGPEIRTGKLASDTSGHETVTLTAGNTITLHTDASYKESSTETDLYVDYAGLSLAISAGSKVLLDDGAIILTAVSSNENSVTCKIENTGDLRSRAGVNLPYADTSDLPAMSDKDKADIKYGMSRDVDIDFVAASFVQTADGVREIRAHIEACARELGWSDDQPLPLIISKIETAGALMHFDEILAESDAIMVARGDLGVEIPLQQVTNAQKEMVAACNAAGKPVIVATQMLESMTKNPRPTRAEVSDVTNAVYDGADAVMTSGETAKGKYPHETITFMNEIILSAERYSVNGALGRPAQTAFSSSPRTYESAVAKAAVAATEERPTAAILVGVKIGGSLPRLVAAYRPNVPIFAFCPTAKMGRLLQLHRGVHPIVSESAVEPADEPQSAIRLLKELGHVQSGDEVVLLAMGDDESLGRMATLKLATVN